MPTCGLANACAIQRCTALFDIFCFTSSIQLVGLSTEPGLGNLSTQGWEPSFSCRRQQSTTNKNWRCTCCRWGWLILIELPVPDLLIQMWFLETWLTMRMTGVTEGPATKHRELWCRDHSLWKRRVWLKIRRWWCMMYDVWMSISGCWNVLWKMRQQTYSKTKVSISLSLSLYIYIEIYSSFVRK